MCDFPDDMKLHLATEDVTVYKLVRVESGLAQDRYLSLFPPDSRSDVGVDHHHPAGARRIPSPLTLPRRHRLGVDVEYTLGGSHASPFDESLGLMAWAHLPLERLLTARGLISGLRVLRCTIPKGTRYLLSESTGMVTTEVLTVVGVA